MRPSRSACFTSKILKCPRRLHLTVLFIYPLLTVSSYFSVSFSTLVQHFQLDRAFLELVGHRGVRSGHHHHLLHPSALHRSGLGWDIEMCFTL